MAGITKNEHKSYGMGLHDEVLTGRTQQTFFNPEEGENFFYHDAYKVDYNKRTSIDIGAYTGAWSTVLSDNFNAVHAFEISADNCECFRKNTESKTGITLYNVIMFNKL